MAAAWFRSFATAFEKGFVTAYPDLADRPRRVQVDCVGPLTPRVGDVLVQAEAALGSYGIPFTVNVLPPSA